MHQERNPTTVSQLLTLIQEWKNKANSLSDSTRFDDPESGSSSEATHVPSQTSTIPSPRTMPRRDSGLPHDTRNITDTSGNVFERPSAQRRDDLLQSTTIHKIWPPVLKNQDLILQELQGDLRVKCKENRWIRQSHYSISKVEVVRWIVLVEVIPTVVWWIIRDSRFRKCILENFQTLWSFKAGKVNFKTEVYSKSADLRLTMHWIKEIETAKSTDEFVTSRTIVGRTDFTRLRFAWCDDCVCIERAFRQAHSLSQKSKCRRAACSKTRQILTWETNCLHDLWAFPCNWSLWSGKRTQMCSEKVCRMTMSKISTLNGIKLFYQWTKYLQMWSWKDCTSQSYKTLFSFQTVLAVYDQGTFRNTMDRRVHYDWRRL